MSHVVLPFEPVSVPSSRPSTVERPSVHVTPDHFIVRGDRCFAGHHMILDCYECGDGLLSDVPLMEEAFREAVQVTGATLLHLHVHPFGEGQGVSGVAVLAESHISVHTWPERQYAAFDLFMCGQAQPALAIPVFQRMFEVGRLVASDLMRGEMPQ